MTVAEYAQRFGLRRVAGRWRGLCPICGHRTLELSEGRTAPLAWCWHPDCDRDRLLRLLRELGVLPAPELSAAARRARAEQRWRDEVDAVPAALFRVGVEALGEAALEELHATDPRRRDLAELLAAVRGAGLLDEYRTWRARNPRWTRALVRAGWRLSLRRQVEAVQTLLCGEEEVHDERI